MERHISFLLGAGFSVPAGYPTAKKLNSLISNRNFGNIGFSPDGRLCFGENNSKPDFGYPTIYDNYFKFLQDVIKEYCVKYCTKKQPFDYEKFYDYLKLDLKTDVHMREIYNSYEHKINSYEQYCYNSETIYNQILKFFLKDNTGKWEYSDEPFLVKRQYYFPYQGFLECVEFFAEKSIVDIHTLNHDLYIDRLKKTEWINGNISDGFEELGSPFYGEIEAHNRIYKCRLERFVDVYNKPIRLYKLHGSLDYYTYYENNQSFLTPNSIVKSKYGVNTTKLLKEISNKSGFEYDECSINYHPSFLSGTTSKILQYKNPLLYEKLFNHFRENLSNSNSLIVIGYSGVDDEVNRIIDASNVATIVVVDKSEDIRNHPLVRKGAIPLQKGVESLCLNDLTKLLTTAVE